MHEITNVENILNLIGIGLEIIGFVLLLPLFIRIFTRNSYSIIENTLSVTTLMTLVKNGIDDEFGTSVKTIMKKCGIRDNYFLNPATVTTQSINKYRIFYNKWYGDNDRYLNKDFERDVEEMSDWLLMIKEENKIKTKIKRIEVWGIFLVISGLSFQGLSVIFHS